VLEPSERISEVLFGLIMVITFTGSLSIAEAGRDDVRTMIIGALGCNLAWGVIDGVFYLLASLAERGRGVMTINAVHAAATPQHAREAIVHALSPLMASVLEPADLELIRQRMLKLPRTEFARLTRQDAVGAFAVFLLVFLSTFPVTTPFLFFRDIPTAMRVSNGIAVLMLLVAGAAYGRAVGRSPWTFSAAMAALGAVLVALTIALGG
jgi:hypothetical protein